MKEEESALLVYLYINIISLWCVLSVQTVAAEPDAGGAALQVAELHHHLRPLPPHQPAQLRGEGPHLWLLLPGRLGWGPTKGSGVWSRALKGLEGGLGPTQSVVV